VIHCIVQTGNSKKMIRVAACYEGKAMAESVLSDCLQHIGRKKTLATRLNEMAEKELPNIKTAAQFTDLKNRLISECLAARMEAGLVDELLGLSGEEIESLDYCLLESHLVAFPGR